MTVTPLGKTTRLVRVAKSGNTTRLVRAAKSGKPSQPARVMGLGLGELIKVARGDAAADLVIVNGRVVNTFTGEIENAGVAIHQGRIAGVGDYTEGKRVMDIGGRYLTPGLIDGHFHLESSYLNVGEYARAVVPRGTLAGVSDLHEIANVCGVPGLKQAMRVARQMPMDLFLAAPSCVPATDMETSGRRLDLRELLRLRRMKNVIGLGEFMDIPGVIGGRRDALDKLEAFTGMPKEGHAPGVRGRDLNAYLAPLIGSDHETVEYAEGLEKLRRGMYLMIREGSVEQNLEALCHWLLTRPGAGACWWWTTATPGTSITRATWTRWSARRCAWAWTPCGRFR